MEWQGGGREGLGMAGVGWVGPEEPGWVETVLLLSPNHRCCPHAGAAGQVPSLGQEGPPPGPQLQVLDRPFGHGQLLLLCLQ